MIWWLEGDTPLALFGVFLPLGHLFKCHGAALADLNGQAVVGSEAMFPQTGGDIVFLVALWYGARVDEIGGVGQFGGWRRSGESGRVVGVGAELAFQGVDPWIGGDPPVALARFAIS